jgi:hypothetical protein
MIECLKFCIADITFALLTDDPDLKIWVDGAMKKFLVEEVEPDIRVQTKWKDLHMQIDGKMIFDSGALWQIYSENGSYLFRFTSSALGLLPYKVASFNRNFTSGEVSLNRSYFDPDKPIYPLEYPLDELMINNFLARGKGVEVHSCGIVDSQGFGHLFVGQSGAGKSTIARLWPDESDVTILSDDRIILRKKENTIWMYGTPWHGEAGLASPAKAPLTRIYFLKHGEKNELVAQKPSDSISHLFVCSFPPFYSGEGIDFTLGFLEGVVRNVPCYELKFIPDKSVVEFIQEERFT